MGIILHLRDIYVFAFPRAQLNLSKNQITCITIVTTASYFRLVQGMAMESLLAYMDTSYEAANDAFKRGIMYEVMKVGCKNGLKGTCTDLSSTWQVCCYHCNCYPAIVHMLNS